MGINGGTGIVGSGAALGGSGIHINRGGVAPFVGLLDTYPNAEAAYSVRQLSSDYAKPTDSEFSFGKALQFDGVNDKVSIGQNLSNVGDVTLSVWFKVNAFKGTYFSILGSDVNTGNYLMVRDVSGQLQCQGFGIFGNKQTLEPSTLGIWNHMGIIKSGANFTVYMNGTNYGSAASSTLSTINLFGKYGTNNSFNPANGVMDEFVWWNTALTEAQILNQWNGGNGNSANIDVEPLLWYNCNEEDGSSTLVNSGSGGASYNGTLNNFDFATCWVDGKANKGALVEIAGYTTTPTFVENKTFYPDENNELSLTSTDAVGTTLASWLSTNSITEGYVRTLYDQSGNANNAQQTTASLQPIIISSGSIVTDNGEPAIDFRGADYYLTLLSTITSQWAFGVQNATAIDNAVNYLYGGAGEGYHVGGTTGSITGWGAFSAAGSRESNNEGLGQKIRAWDGNKLFENGVEESYSDTGNAGEVDIIVLGTRSDFTAFSFTGFFQEVVFYNSNQEANVVGIYENQNSRYNVVV
jgi:hypothetical protein